MFQFSIKTWRAVSSRMASGAQWRAWADDPAVAAQLPDYRPALAFLPAMQRRRLNTAARLMVDAMWPLLGTDEHLPVVYSSHDGEINRSVALWLSLLREQSISPTSFGLSVHNALVGQWSMLRQDMSEATALCAREDGLEVAFVDACGLLAEGAPQVMVVVADEPLAEEAPGVVRAPLAYAVAFVLTAGDEWRLGCQPAVTTPAAMTGTPEMHHAGMSAGGPPAGCAAAAAVPPAGPDASHGYWGALDWLRHHLAGERSFVLARGRRQWLWEQRP